PVRRDPAVRFAEPIELVAVSPPVDEDAEPEAGEDLRHLRRMPERVGNVGDLRDRPERPGDGATEEQVPHVCLARWEERVRLHVPGPDGEASFANSALERLAASRTDREIVLDHDPLAVEQEAIPRVFLEEIENAIDRVDQASAERLERTVPLAVPVEVR